MKTVVLFANLDIPRQATKENHQAEREWSRR